MLGRRRKPSLARRVRQFVWPETGFRRAWLYIAARLDRLKKSPHALAAGFASGAAVSFTPLLGLHFFLAFVLAYLTRGSMIAAALGTVVGNPVTFPFIFAATYWLGTLFVEVTETPQEVGQVIAEGFDEEAEREAEVAADAVLATAEDLLHGEWTWSAVEEVWPTLATMLIGALPLVPLAYVFFYFVTRSALRAYLARRQRRLRR